MNWQQIQEYVYYRDGSLRDIYIRNVNRADWQKLVDYLNSSYDVEFEIGERPKASQISFSELEKYWNGELLEPVSATIRIQGIIVKTYFFIVEEIEFDIAPQDLDTFEKHNALLDFLTHISRLLSKTVELTDENGDDPTSVLVSITDDNITFTKR